MRDDEKQNMMADAAITDDALHQALDAYAVAPAGKALADAIAARAEAESQWLAADFEPVVATRSWVPRVAALAACMMLGFWLGTSTSPYSAAPHDGGVRTQTAAMEPMVFGPRSMADVLW